MEQGRVGAEGQARECYRLTLLLTWAGRMEALVNAGELWYPIVQQLHRFVTAISRVSVNHDVRGLTLGSGSWWSHYLC